MSAIDEVKSRVDIVELVGGYVNLLRSGGSFKANCPFHQERTPSFYVFPDRQSWRCFGACAEGGDALSFIMKAEGLEFRDALRRLAERVGVTLETRQQSGVSAELFAINDAALLFYRQQLATPEAAFVRDYLANRGLAERTIQTFELGYSPPRDNRLLAHLDALGFAPPRVVVAGLARETDDARYYDLFRGRLMIPIRDWSGRLAGFGSRALDDSDAAKYINTPRTAVFDKSAILYAMHLAKEPVRQQGAVIVEGYMDAIMAHQNGYDNVVASMGTALTEQQVAQVRRLTGKVTMALDGDAAGRNATLRSLESSWGVFQRRAAQSEHRAGQSLLQPPQTLDLLIAELPPGQDPDDIIRESPDAWPDFLAQASPLFDYLLDTLKARADLSTPDGRSWVARMMLRFVAQIPDAVKRDFHLETLSTQLGVSLDTLHAELPAARQSGEPRRGRPAPNRVDDDNAPLPPRSGDINEETLLALVLQHEPELVPEATTTVTPEWFSRAENREIFRIVTGTPAGTAEPGPELTAHLDQLRSRQLQLSGTPEQSFQKLCQSLQRKHQNNAIIELAAAVQESGDLYSAEAAQLTELKAQRLETDRAMAGVQ